MLDFITQHAGAIATALGSGFVLNTLSSLLVGRVNKQSTFWKFIQAIHGLLNRIDPETK